jgi:hypothetical protein
VQGLGALTLNTKITGRVIIVGSLRPKYEGGT